MAKPLDVPTPCRIRVTKEVTDIFPRCRPEVGGIYDAIYRNPRLNLAEFCVIEVRGMKTILRRGEFEVV